MNVRVFLLALLCVLASACQRTASPMRHVGQEEVILAFGDSLTESYGSSAGKSYPELLSAATGVRVVNGGLSGEETAAGLARLPRLLDQYKPALVLLCEGGNDMLRGRDRTATARNLRDMIVLVRKHQAQVVLIGVPTPELSWFRDLRTDPVYKQVADQELVPYEDKILAQILSDPALKADQVHPNDHGNALIAFRLVQFLQARGALD